MKSALIGPTQGKLQLLTRVHSKHSVVSLRNLGLMAPQTRAHKNASEVQIAEHLNTNCGGRLC